MRSLLVLAAIVALAHADGLMESGEAESEWQGGMDDSFTKVGNTMVRYFDHNKTYVEARRHCVSQNSRLLEIWNEEEWNEITQWVSETMGPESVYLIGLTDLDIEGKFVWGSGRQLSEDVAAFWKPGQPNNHYGLEHCTCIVNELMMDRICEDPSPKDPKPHGFVCQKRIQSGNPMTDMMQMVVRMVSPLLNEMAESSQAYMTTEGDDCSAPPANNEMMSFPMAMRMTCRDGSPGANVCMCASLGMMGMDSFSLMCGTCDMQLKPSGRIGMLMDMQSFLVSYMEGMMGDM